MKFQVHVCGALAATWLATSASAMQMDVTPAELCRISTAVVVGEVTDIETRWVEGEHGAIERLAAISVSQVPHGSLSQDIVVTLPGGTLDGLVHWVEDVPRLRVDTAYMLTLEQRDGRWMVIGGEAGAVALATPEHRLGVPLQTALNTLKGCR